MTQVSQAPASTRAQIKEATLRKDPWWRAAGHHRRRADRLGRVRDLGVPGQRGLLLEAVHLAVVLAVPGHHAAPRASGFDWIPWLTWLTPAIIIIGGPLGFRLTCYYYRKAYYRAFWRAPAACAVREPHAKYTGETRFPLILQNVHRYFFWIAIVFNVILTTDAVIAFRNHQGQWGHMGLGTLILLVNAALLWLYSLSCHACRHMVGGRLKHFSKHPARYWMWTQVSKLNVKHQQFAWVIAVLGAVHRPVHPPGGQRRHLRPAVLLRRPT